MAPTEGLTNMERFYEERADDALDTFNEGRFEESGNICTELLTHPRLSFLWRAQANLILATRKDNTAIEFAKDALKYYNIMLAETPDDEHLQENKHEAQHLVDACGGEAQGAGRGCGSRWRRGGSGSHVWQRWRRQEQRRAAREFH